MGNCFGSPNSHHPNPSSSSNFPQTPGTSNNGSSRTTTDLLTTNSSAGRSRFFSEEQASETTKEDDEEEEEEEVEEWSARKGRILKSSHLKVFTFAELKSATKNFRADTLLGQGGFGKVYKGWIDERTLAPSKSSTGMVVAIKKLNSESVQGFDEWQAEVNFLGTLSHPNLVKLLGYCWEDAELLLVYEFMPKGSLENHLFRRNPAIEPFSWELRLKIAIGAAHGLAFLHTSKKKVIYRDFKASNILLDATYTAKISDFGLAKLGPSGGESHVTTRIMGTYGYAAPEYVATGHLYVKSDVYGFGVVLLEMLTGLRAFDSKRPKQNLVEWLKPILFEKRKLKTIIDGRIEGQYSSKAVWQVAQITLQCLEPDPKSRPSMKEVVEVLERIEAMEKSKESRSSSSSSTTFFKRLAGPTIASSSSLPTSLKAKASLR